MQKLLSLLCIGVSCTVPTFMGAAPEIAKIVWGSVTVTHADGTEHTYKDCKVFPKGSMAWDWSIAGTQHKPGIQAADLSDFIDDVDVVILTAGMKSMLEVAPGTYDYISSKKKTVYREETKKAVELYKKLVAEGKRVGIVIHSTC